MKELMEKMMAKKNGKSADKKQAKMSTLKNLRDEMSKMMSGEMDGLKKVTVSAKDNKGLEAGLKKAKEMLEDQDE